MRDYYSYLPDLLSLALLQTVAVISPGPDFALVLRNSLVHSRRAAILSALGIALGVGVHLTYILAGLGALIARSVWLFTMIKVLGCGYLMYIGVMGLQARQAPTPIEEEPLVSADISMRKALIMGFLTNALNPKAILFFLSVFTVAMHADVPWSIRILGGLEVVLITLIWFIIVAIGFSHKNVRVWFAEIKHWVERVTGICLIILGLKLLFTKL
jgi:RhtB (resistance to homoserine/threonine) family protein